MYSFPSSRFVLRHHNVKKCCKFLVSTPFTSANLFKTQIPIIRYAERSSLQKSFTMVQRNTVRDIDLSIRFKCGTQTVFLYIDPVATFSHVQEELLETLKERYPDGITASPKSTTKTQLPSDASQIRFALLKSKTDPAQGWEPLDFDLDDTPADKGFQDNMMVAFAFATDDDDADDVRFEVMFPSYDEEGEDAGGL
ncbi:hypothetical protein F5Y14DRAFT_119519 [Nemania sp. NC0429]|nr:hypothetical protein F5Y14DRAFT_119519 [Nemania sp. NC0429]